MLVRLGRALVAGGNCGTEGLAGPRPVRPDRTRRAHVRTRRRVRQTPCLANRSRENVAGSIKMAANGPLNALSEYVRSTRGAVRHQWRRGLILLAVAVSARALSCSISLASLAPYFGIRSGSITNTATTKRTMNLGAIVGNATYVWRSAVGVRTDGSLVFVVGASMSVKTLANIVHDARAARAMELDLNQSSTNVITYTHAGNGVAVPQMLPQNEHPNPYRCLQPSSRDFVAVLAR
jgi:hypothetical protein